MAKLPKSRASKSKPKSNPMVSSPPEPAAKVTAYIHDLDQDVVEAELALVRHDGERLVRMLPRGDLRSEAKVRQVVDPLGINLTDADLKRLAQAYNIETALTRYVVSQPGWRAGGAFAWPHRVIEEAGRQLSFRPAATSSLMRVFAKRQGDIDTWNKVVCPRIATSDFALTLCGVVFAGPLLRFSRAPEGAIFAVSGDSSTGKTDCCLAALAIMGDPTRMDLPSWDATVNGIKDLIATLSDVTIVIDDTSRDGLPDRDRLRFLNDVGHALAGGGNRARANVYAVQHGIDPIRRPALGVTSGEVSPDDLVKHGGVLRGGGRVRFIDIGVPEGAVGGVFNRLKPSKARGREDSSQTALVEPTKVAEARLAAKRLEAAISECHGVSFPVYLDYLEAQRPVLEAKVRKIEIAFVKELKVKHRNLVGIELRIAQKFGLVLAGLKLAIKAGAVSWDKKQVEQAVLTCCRAALKRQAEERERRSKWVSALRRILVDPAQTPELGRSEVPPPTAVAFRRKVDGKEMAYMTPEKLGATLGIAGHQMTAFVAHLAAKGYIINGIGAARTRPVKVGGKPVRYCVFNRAFYRKRPSARKLNGKTRP